MKRFVICFCIVISAIIITNLSTENLLYAEAADMNENINIKNLINDKSGWKKSGGILDFSEDSLTVSGNCTAAGYNAQKYGNAGVSFYMNVNLDPNDGWVCVFLRAASPTKVLWESEYNYALSLGVTGNLLFYKYIKGEQQVLASCPYTPPLDGSDFKVDFNARLTDSGSVLLTAVLDGIEYLSYDDKNDPITEEGYFCIMTYMETTAVISDKPIEKEIEQAPDAPSHTINYDMNTSALSTKYGGVYSNMGGWFSNQMAGISEMIFDESHVSSYRLIRRGYAGYAGAESENAYGIKFSLGDGYIPSGGLMFEMFKKRPDSFYGQAFAVDKNNYGYGLSVDGNGSVAFVKFGSGASKTTILQLDYELDIYSVNEIIIEREILDERHAKFNIFINGNGYTCRDNQYDKNYNGGFFGISTFDTNADMLFDYIRMEKKADCGVFELYAAPVVYLADYIEDGGKKYIHFRYYGGYPCFAGAIIRSIDSTGESFEKFLKFPERLLDITNENFNEYTIIPVSADGTEGEPVSVKTDSIYNPSPVDSRIAVIPDENGAYFYKKSDGIPFIIKGGNYIRLRYNDHSTFEAPTERAGDTNVYDKYDSESLFKAMAQNGMNTVRVFIIGRSNDNPGIAGENYTDGIYEPYMDNFIDFLTRAKKYGVYVIPAFGDGELPVNDYYSSLISGLPHTKNILYLTQQGIDARKEYITDVLKYIKEKNADLLEVILGVELQNEMVLNADEYPFDKNTGVFKGADGIEYDLSSREQRQALADNGVKYYISEMSETIKNTDPELLVCEGVYTLHIRGKNPDRDYGMITGGDCPPTAEVLLSSALDFADIHFYYFDSNTEREKIFELGWDSMRLSSDISKEALKKKPLIMGEFGSFRNIDTDLEKASETMTVLHDTAISHGFRGALYWTIDCFEQADMTNLLDYGGAMFKVMPEFSIELKEVDISKISKADITADITDVTDVTDIIDTTKSSGKLIPLLLAAAGVVLAAGAGAVFFIKRKKNK